MDQNATVKSVLILVIALVAVTGAMDNKANIGLKNVDGQDILLDSVTGFVSKLNEPLNLWCESEREWTTCYWYWDIEDIKQKYCRISINGSLEGNPGCSLSGKRCLFKGSKTTQEEHEGLWKCTLGIRALR